jgi:hypothetical protein
VLGGPPQSYDLVAVAADPPAANRVRSLLIEWSRAGNYPGIAASELTDGLVEQDRITIIRK